MLPCCRSLFGLSQFPKRVSVKKEVFARCMATEGRFCSIDLPLPQGTLKLSKWSTAGGSTKELDRLNDFVVTNLRKITSQARQNGTFEFSLPMYEAKFNLAAAMAPNRNRKLGDRYKLVGIPYECVLADDDYRRPLQVVPKFALFRQGCSMSLKIKNYAGYIGWCELLLNSIERCEGGLDFLVWTSRLQQAMESIYGLKCIEKTEMPFHLMSVSDMDDPSSWYTAASYEDPRSWLPRLERFLAAAPSQGPFSAPSQGPSSSSSQPPAGFAVQPPDESRVQMEKPKSECLLCMDNKATYLMMPCKHLTHCENCRIEWIDNDRKANGKHHEGVSPSQKLNKKTRASYTMACVVCRQNGQLVLWKNQVAFIP